MTPELEESMHTTGRTLMPTEQPSLEGVLDAAKDVVLDQLRERPYTTLIVAVAAGYVIGVATPKWALNLAWTVGSRFATGKLVAALT